MAPSVYLRGGIPRHLSGGASTTVGQWAASLEGITNHFHFENLGANPIILSFTQAAADAAEGVIIPVGLGVIGNPLSLAIEARDFWVQTTVGLSTWTLLALLRRG